MASDKMAFFRRGAMNVDNRARFTWDGIICVLLTAGSILLGSLAVLELRGQTIRSLTADLLKAEDPLLVSVCVGIGIAFVLATTHKLKGRSRRSSGLR